MGRTLGVALLLLGVLGLGAWIGLRPDPGGGSSLDATEPARLRTAPVLLGSSGEKPEEKGEKGEKEHPAVPPEQDPVPAPPVRYFMTGTVFDLTTQRPIPGAVVIGMVGTDYWALRAKDSEVVCTEANEEGEYELAFLLSDLPTTLVYTVLATGYRTPGAIPEDQEEGEVGGAATHVTVKAAGRGTVDFWLTSGMEVGGRVVDPEGRPVPGVEITVSENTKTSTGYVEFPVADAQGRFSVHDLTRPQFNRGKEKGTLDFAHPERVAVRIEDVYAMSAQERRALRIVMPVGLRLQGTIRHANGEPAVGVLVAAYAGESNTGRRGAFADEEGRFVLRGLTPGKLILRAHSGEHLSFVRREITLLRHEDDFDLRLEAAPIAHTAKREEILGLELVYMPPKARAHFEFYERHAMLITAVTDEAPEELKRYARVGDILWRVGRIHVESVRDVARGVVKRVDWWTEITSRNNRPPPAQYSIGFVIGMRRPDLDGTYTGSLKLPAAQGDAFRRYLAEHPEED